MSKILTILIVALTLLGGIFLISKTKSAPASGQNWPPQTDEQAAVTVTVTPTDISPRSTEWKFDIYMNTHSVELDQDLTQSAVLIVGTQEYKPVRWDGPTGGHHREGSLVFKPISPAPESITLKIKSIAQVDRNFTWQLH